MSIPGYGRPGETLRRDEQGRVRDERGRIVGEDGSRYYPPEGWTPHREQPKRVSRNKPLSLWEQAIHLWNDLVLGFGHPVDLVRWVFIRALEHRAIGYWLRNLEDVVRRAIRADAYELDVPAPKPRPRKPPPPPTADTMTRFRAADPENPLTWRVAFRMSVPGPKVRRKPRGPRPEPRERRPAKGYAHRIEALRRAINDRKDYALRYARRVARQQAEMFRSIEPSVSFSQSGDAPAPHEIAVRNAKHEEPG